MTQIKKRAVEIIQRIPDDDMVYVVNILENLESLIKRQNIDKEQTLQTDDIAYTLNSSDKPVVADGKEMEQVANQIFNKYGGAFEKLAK